MSQASVHRQTTSSLPLSELITDTTEYFCFCGIIIKIHHFLWIEYGERHLWNEKCDLMLKSPKLWKQYHKSNKPCTCTWPPPHTHTHTHTHTQLYITWYYIIMKWLQHLRLPHKVWSGATIKGRVWLHSRALPFLDIGAWPKIVDEMQNFVWWIILSRMYYYSSITQYIYPIFTFSYRRFSTMS